MSNNNNIPKIRFKGFTEEWKQLRIDQIVNVNSGRDYKHLSIGCIPVYGTGGYMLSVNYALSYNKDAIGIGRKGTINKPYILNAPFWTVDTLFYVIPQADNDLQFTYDIFQLIDWKSKDESTGVPSLSKETINNVIVKVASPDEQKAIGNYFKNIDKLITDNKQKLEKLKNLKAAYLEKMFPKNGATTPEIRFKGFSEEWSEKSLNDVGARFDSLRVPVSAINRITGNTPYYGANGIQDYVDGHTHIGEYLLIAEDGANDLVDYPIQYVCGEIWVNNHAHVFQAIEGIAYNLCIKYILSKTDIRSFLVGGGRAKLNAEIMMKINILIPIELKEQEKIGNFFKNLDDQVAKERMKLEKLKNIKSACLEKMFVNR